VLRLHLAYPVKLSQYCSKELASVEWISKMNLYCRVGLSKMMIDLGGMNEYLQYKISKQRPVLDSLPEESINYKKIPYL
jgi:hypothetical protein